MLDCAWGLQNPNILYQETDESINVKRHSDARSDKVTVKTRYSKVDGTGIFLDYIEYSRYSKVYIYVA